MAVGRPAKRNCSSTTKARCTSSEGHGTIMLPTACSPHNNNISHATRRSGVPWRTRSTCNSLASSSQDTATASDASAAADGGGLTSCAPGLRAYQHQVSNTSSTPVVAASTAAATSRADAIVGASPHQHPVLCDQRRIPRIGSSAGDGPRAQRDLQRRVWPPGLRKAQGISLRSPDCAPTVHAATCDARTRQHCCVYNPPRPRPHRASRVRRVL